MHIWRNMHKHASCQCKKKNKRGRCQLGCTWHNFQLASVCGASNHVPIDIGRAFSDGSRYDVPVQRGIHCIAEMNGKSAPMTDQETTKHKAGVSDCKMLDAALFHHYSAGMTSRWVSLGDSRLLHVCRSHTRWPWPLSHVLRHLSASKMSQLI